MKNKRHLAGMSFALLLTIFTSCENENVGPKANLSQSESLDQTASVPSNLMQTVGNGTFTIVNRKSGKVLDVTNSSSSNGANIRQWVATGANNQKWTLAVNSEGYYSITNVQSGKALDIYQSGTADGSNLIQWDYWGGNNQQWEFVSAGNGYYNIVNRNSGKSLDVAGQSTIDHANVAQWGYWGGSNQQWALTTGSGGTADGQLGWTLTSTGAPQDVKDRITAAMNAAVARYNKGASWPARTLTVEYNTGVATADANISGHIRFGANTSYQNERTALHEIAHTYGVGTSSNWSSPLIQNYDFVGAQTVTLIEAYDGSGATISTGGSHFWPYGLNYNNEWSETNAQRHVEIVRAMVQDGL